MEPILTDFARRVDIIHTAVLVIDMQNAYCAEGYPEGVPVDKSAIRSIISRLQYFLSEMRKKNAPVFFIGSIMREEDFSDPIRELCIRNYGRDVRYCMKGSWEAEFIPELQPDNTDTVIEKSRYSAFVKTELDTRLRDMGIETIIVTGVGTNVCVETTCRDGFMRDYYIVVPKDLVATTDSTLHEGSLANLNRYFAAVTTSDEILGVYEGRNLDSAVFD